MKVDIMNSDITGRLFNLADTTEGDVKGLLQEAGNTISALRESIIERDENIKSLRNTLADRVQTINKREEKIRKLEADINDLREDKDAFRLCAVHMVENA